MTLSFDEEEDGNIKFSRANNPALKKSKMSQWLIEKGVVKSEKAAQWVVLIVAVLCIGAAFFILMNQNLI